MDQIRGVGDGRILGSLDRANLELTAFTKPGTLLQADRIVVTQWQSSGARLRLTDNIDPGHERLSKGETWTFHKASLLLLRPAAGAAVVLVDNGTAEVTLATAAAFRIQPPGSVPGESFGFSRDPYDPSYRFTHREPSSLSLHQDFPLLRLRGDFSLKISELTFCLQQGGIDREFRSLTQRAGTDTGPRAAELENKTFYVVDVFGGELDAAGYVRRLDAYLPQLAIDVQGALEIIGDEYRELRGSVHAEAKPLTMDRFEVAYRHLASEPAGSVALTSAAPASPVPWIGSLLLGLAVAGGTTWGVRQQQRRNPAKAPLSAGLPATGPPPPAPTTLAAAESAYRRDPANLLLGLELGMAYLKEDRVDDALPLLLLATQAYPKADVARYHAGLALLMAGRTEDAVKQLHYAFRLNPFNVARFLKEGPAASHGRNPLVRELLSRWARVFHDTQHRGYA